MKPENNKKILIIDDDEFVLGIYAKNFRDNGFEVLTAHDGEEAWEIISSGNTPDVIFTGITMPRMTGFELIAKLQTDSKLANIPVAVNSHRGRPEDEKLAKEMGVDDFIVQGITTPTEVIRRIKALVGMQDIFKVVILTEKNDGTALANMLNKQQETSYSSNNNKEAILEIQAESETGKFTIKLISNEK